MIIYIFHISLHKNNNRCDGRIEINTMVLLRLKFSKLGRTQLDNTKLVKPEYDSGCLIFGVGFGS